MLKTTNTWKHIRKKECTEFPFALWKCHPNGKTFPWNTFSGYYTYSWNFILFRTFKENFHGKGERQVISNSGRRCQVTAIRGDKWNAIGVRQLRESDENTLLHPKICRWLSETNMWRSAIGMWQIETDRWLEKVKVRWLATVVDK